MIALCIYAAKMYFLRDYFFIWRLTPCHDGFDLQFKINIFSQWVMGQAPLDWNPFIAAGQPMSLMSNISFYVPVIILSKLLLLTHIEVTPLQFSTLFYLSLYLQFCTGSILLFQVLYNRKAISVIGGGTVAFSGFFVENVYEPGSITLLFFLPYLLFFLAHSFKTGRWIGILFFSLFLGGVFGHYNPMYSVAFFAVFFAVLAFPASNSFLGLWLKRLFSAQPYKILFCAVLFLLTFGPTLQSFKEMGNFVSPTRGYTVRGVVTSTNLGEANEVRTSFYNHIKLFNGEERTGRDSYGHNNYYIGALSFLLLFFIPLLWGDSLLRGFIIAAISMGILAAGSHAHFWVALVDHIPLINTIRVPSFFSQYLDFICIVIAMGAIKTLLNRTVPLVNKFFSIALMVFFLVLIRNDVPESVLHLLLGAFGIITLSSILVHYKTPAINLVKQGGLYSKAVNLKDPVKITLALFFAFQAYDLGSFAKNDVNKLCWLHDYQLQQIHYPETWQSMCFDCKPEVPVDSWPSVEKEIIWGHPKHGFNYLMDKDFSLFWRNMIQPRGVFFGKIFYLITAKVDALTWSISPQFADSYKKTFVNLLNSVGEFENKVAHVYLRPPFDLESGGYVKPFPTNNPNHLTLFVNAERNSYLFRMENYHPGWKAFVDGKETVIEKVSPFQLIPISQGSHEVTFEFHTAFPFLVNIATFSTILGWGFMMLWLKNGARGTLIVKQNRMKSKSLLLFVISAMILVWAPLPALKSQKKTKTLEPYYFTDPNRYSMGPGVIADAGFAFDGNNISIWKTMLADGPGRAWIARRFDSPKKVSMFTITIRPETNEEAPPAMMVYGSMDGESWEIIGFTHNLTWEKGETKAFTIQNLKQGYLYYKLKFERHQKDVSIAEIKLFDEEEKARFVSTD